MGRLYVENASGPGTLASSRELAELQGRIEALKQEVRSLNYRLANAHRFAYHDVLTGLPNRRLLQDRFVQAAARGVRQRHQAALLFVDLDRFKEINDMYGHEVGDAVLVQVAARLAGCIRASDTACRYGGDEFVILLPEIEDRKQARIVIEKIRARLREPYPVGCAAITSSASIGMAVCPVDGCELGDLIQASDRDMYGDKARRRARATAFDSRPEQTAFG